jgi:peroxiredoxin
LQERIGDIRGVGGEVIAVATKGDLKSEEKTRKALDISFGLVPEGGHKLAEALGIWNDRRKQAVATIIVDKKGAIRFIYESLSDTDRPGTPWVIDRLREISREK